MKIVEVDSLRSFIKLIDVYMLRYALISSSRFSDEEEATSITALDCERKEIIKFDIKRYFSQHSEFTKSSISSFEMKQILAEKGIQSDYGEWGPVSAQWHCHIRKTLDI